MATSNQFVLVVAMQTPTNCFVSSSLR